MLQEAYVFQLTASRRGWRKIDRNYSASKLFQLTASRRGWLPDRMPVRQMWYFNSQPHEEADHGETVEPPGKQYFNSQPHEEADGRPARIQSRHQDISTHSLTKRLTINSFQLQNHFFISTHSLTKRLTRLLFLPLLRLRYFNSQPHEEADDRCVQSFLWVIISTHSLTKRLTGVDVSIFSLIEIFQLTASRRGWQCQVTMISIINIISTHSLTKRLTADNEYYYTYPDISTHSLTKRLTQKTPVLIQGSDISTHSLTKRLTDGYSSTRRYGTISTHSLTKRLTERLERKLFFHWHFNSQPHEEADAWKL